MPQKQRSIEHDSYKKDRYGHKRWFFAFLKQQIQFRNQRKQYQKYLNIYFLISMTTVAETAQDIHFVNIFSVAEERMQTNFGYILQKLREHDRFIAQNANSIAKNRQASCQEAQQNMKLTELKFDQFMKNLKTVQERLGQNEEEMRMNRQTINQNKEEIFVINETLLNTKLEFDQKLQIKENQINEVDEKAKALFIHIDSIENALTQKQNVVDAEKLDKKVVDLIKKYQIVDNDIKLIQFKLEKIQILSQKAERNQAKKDAQMTKEIEERIRREMRGTHKEPSFNKMDQGFFKLEEDMERQYMTSSVNAEKNIHTISQKVANMENKFKQLQETLKGIKEEGFKGKGSNVDNFVEKINELKPQMIKLWAKFDTLEDRIGFTDKKLEDKSKLLNSLIEFQKENSWVKMEDKLKAFQTQVYAFQKEIKTKVQGKVATQDYEKHNIATQNKLKQLTEQLFQKSDKIQVKKALLFLQSKIKQIILVISEDQENQKDALLTKKQLKCISCDKDVEKMAFSNNMRGNWDNMPYRDHAPEILGRFGMTSYGSLAKKLKKLENQDLPILTKKTRQKENTEKSP